MFRGRGARVREMRLSFRLFGYERFALQATALGIRTAFVGPIVEVPAVRSQFASWLGAGDRRPDLVVRFGHGPATARSHRRPIEQVLV